MESRILWNCLHFAKTIQFALSLQSCVRVGINSNLLIKFCYLFCRSYCQQVMEIHFTEFPENAVKIYVLICNTSRHTAFHVHIFFWQTLWFKIFLTSFMIIWFACINMKTFAIKASRSFVHSKDMVFINECKYLCRIDCMLARLLVNAQ